MITDPYGNIRLAKAKYCVKYNSFTDTQPTSWVLFLLNDLRETSTMSYKVFTLNARELINLCEDSNYNRCFDLNSGYLRDKLIKPGNNRDRYYSASALLDQISKTLASGDMDYDTAKKQLTGNLVFLDFGRMGIKGIEEETEKLINEGFSIRFPESSDFVHFTPFEKSASMSRNNTISFINDAIFDMVNARLGLDLDWTSIELIPSKYYAYRGLYLTDGKRIERKSLELNEKTVVVINSGSKRLKNVDYITANEENLDGHGDIIRVSEDNTKRKKSGSFDITTFDGEGFISPGYALEIREALGEGNKGEKSTSFQIRMPFSKGMLHEVDFKDFIRKEFPEEDILKLEIEDCFGIKRKLCDIEIIMTDSMFKCGKWLSEFNARDGLKLSDGVVTHDPMQYFFDKMHKYEHAMYIVSTNRNIRSKRQIKMSYQFLNTLDIEGPDFEAMIRKHVDGISLLRSDANAAMEALLGNSGTDSVNPEDNDAETTRKLTTLEYALYNNPAFLNDPAVKKEIANIENTRTNGIMEGKIYIDGTIKYLSMDLLGLLLDIAEKCNVTDKNKIRDWKKTKKIYRDGFYLAGWRGYGMKKENYYGILRNPHLSRNEQCALRPFSSNIYNKYFGGLKGIIMTGYESVVPTALAGADFDGDMVKIVFDEAINNAILRGVYKEKEESPKTGIMLYERKLPIALINSPKGKDSKRRIGKNYNGKKIYITFEDVAATFSSRVGHISNLAIDIGRLEYYGSNVPEGSAALCTIATGLEIDSVKTGVSPDLTYLESICDAEADGYMNANRRFKAFREDETKNKKVVHGRINEENGALEAFLKYRNKPEEILFSINGSSDINIDKLAYLYVKQLIAGKERKDCRFFGLPEHRFMFESSYISEDEWRKEAFKDPRIDSLKGIIGAYRKLMADTAGIGSNQKAIFCQGRIIRLMQVEYNLDEDVLARSKSDIIEAINKMYEEVYNALPDIECANNAITRMIAGKWEFVPRRSLREEDLKTILGVNDLSPEVEELLCDSYDNGYQILNYVLQDVKRIRTNEDDEYLTSDKKSKWGRCFDEDFYGKLYRECYKTYEKRSVWARRACEICRKKVVELFGPDNLEDAIKCTLALDSGEERMDENHDFLWNIYTKDDIRDLLYR